MNSSLRPKSLQEAIEFGSRHGSPDAFVREFLDEFYTEFDPKIRQSMIDQRPLLTEDPRLNAYVAAAAEHLALKNDLEIPDWALDGTRFLHSPFFPIGLESLKATLLKESPSAFRRRMIFVDSDPLSRPRKQREVA